MNSFLSRSPWNREHNMRHRTGLTYFPIHNRIHYKECKQNAEHRVIRSIYRSITLVKIEKLTRIRSIAWPLLMKFMQSSCSLRDAFNQEIHYFTFCLFFFYSSLLHAFNLNLKKKTHTHTYVS